MSAPEKRDNYQITLVRTRELFLKYDQRAIIDRFSLNADERYLYLTFVARPYRIERATGAIEFLKDRWRPAGHGDGMTIYDILCDSKPDARVSGRFQNAWILWGCSERSSCICRATDCPRRNSNMRLTAGC